MRSTNNNEQQKILSTFRHSTTVLPSIKLSTNQDAMNKKISSGNLTYRHSREPSWFTRVFKQICLGSKEKRED